MDLFNKISLVAQAQSKLFPNGYELFKIMSRLLEEWGKVSWELNHYERTNVSIERNCKDNKENIVNEAFQVVIVLNQLLQYFDLSDDFANKIEMVYKEFQDKGYINQ
ncbi:hypothetical protein [Clostridium sp. C2-6-12]|uniref:hypothetical protein n=1 Tax=Clostridium sp. C2-6-12 TaxID=2698832 RepID=UPI0013696C02|nr:hypothetical protein [Clostridium sp. C2-6-12]